MRQKRSGDVLVAGSARGVPAAEGSVDLQWNPAKRGLSNYIVEMTDDPAALTGRHIVASPTKSSTTLTGLTSGKRYWFRVAANGSAGPGPTSDPATKSHRNTTTAAAGPIPARRM